MGAGSVASTMTWSRATKTSTHGLGEPSVVVFGAWSFWLTPKFLMDNLRLSVSIIESVTSKIKTTLVVDFDKNMTCRICC